MAKKEVFVVINGEEFVSKSAEQAEGAMAKLSAKVKSLSFADVKAGWDMVMGAVQKFGGAIMDTFRAADEFEAAQRKLQGTSKLTGISMGTLTDIANAGKQAFQLSTVVANDFASEIGKLTSKAGDITKSKDAMAAFLEIGAARGMGAADTLKAVQQAVLGIDEGTDKLFGKNPSVLYEEYADKIGKSAGKLSDQEKALALVDAAMIGGERTRGSYAAFLDTAAGKQQLMTQRIEEAKAQFGSALNPLRLLVMDGLVQFVEWVSRPEIAAFAEVLVTIGRNLVDALAPAFNVLKVVAQPVLTVIMGLLAEASFAVRAYAAFWQDSFGSAVRAIAGFGESVAGILRKVGIDLNTEGLSRMRAYGEAQVKEADTRWTTLTKEHKAFWARFTGEAKAGEAATVRETTAATAVHVKAVQARAAAIATEGEKINAALSRSLGAPLKATIGMTEGAIRSLADAAKEQLPPDAAAQFSAHMRTLADRAKEVGDRITAVPEPVKKGGEHARDMAREVGGIVRGAIDASTAFGVIDDKAARTLTSAGNIAEALGRMQQSGFTFEGVVGVIGGVASIVSNMMQGDKERRQLTEMNNRRLLELNRGLSNLKLNVTGEDYQSFFGALKTLFGNLDTGAGLMPSLLQFDKTLGNMGLTPADLNKVAESYGIAIRRSNGDLDLEQLRKLFDAMSRVGIGGGQRSFEERVQLYREGQELSGGSSLQKALDLVSYLSQSGVGALGGIETTDQTMLFNALMGVRARLSSGQIGADELGGLTANQLNNLLYELLSSIRPESAPADSVVRATTTTDDVVETTANVQMSVASVQEVIEAMHAGVVDVLTEHTALHDRIAKATEGSYERLTSIDAKMDDLIATTAGQTARVNRELGEVRQVALANAGRGPEFA